MLENSLLKPVKLNWTLLPCAEEEEVVLRPEIVHETTKMMKMKEEEEEEEAIAIRSLGDMVNARNLVFGSER